MTDRTIDEIMDAGYDPDILWEYQADPDGVLTSLLGEVGPDDPEYQKWKADLDKGLKFMRGGKENPGDLPRLTELVDEGYGSFEDYYPESAAHELEPSDPYYGRNVIWDGISGQMVRVQPDMAQAIDGNQFDPDKLASIVSGIDEAQDRVVFTAPYGTIHFITPDDIRESIEYAEDYPDYVLTTGDADLDEWLVDPSDFSPEEARDSIEALEHAVEHNEGDLGSFTFTLRDGNHRAFGAMIAGEPYVYMILEDNQFQDLDPDFPGDQAILDILE